MIVRSLARLTALAFVVAFGFGAAPAFDPKPWLSDLDQMRLVVATQDADLEWEVFTHEADLPGLFADARARVLRAEDDGDARAVFDRLVRRLDDGHVELHWPGSPQASAETAPDACAHYDAARNAGPLAALAQGYVALETPQSDVFPIGIIASSGHRVGVLKIGAFGPSAAPALCRQALAALSIAANRPCDDACADRIDAWTDARFTEDYIAQIEALKRAGIDTLLVDVAGNGGGSEWVDAATRMLTAIRLKSSRQDFVRGAHWVKKWSDLEAHLRQAARAASGADRALLLRLADEAATKKVVADTPCDSAPLWRGEHPACSWLGEGFYDTGLLQSADPETLRGKPWAADVFHPMEFEYREGIWRGPLIVLVDYRSASASVRFAAELQDNRAALILGEPTDGSVGGHTDGGTSTILLHSGGVLLVPDIGGGGKTGAVVPDVLVGFRKTDGPHLRAAAFLAKLPEALARLPSIH